MEMEWNNTDRLRSGVQRIRDRRGVVFLLSLFALASSAAFAADTQAPTAPGALTKTAATSTSISLSWTASTDNVGVTAYLVERCQGAGCSNFAQVTSTVSLTYNNTGLTVLTSYSYRVRARDAANNKSGYSNVVTVVTPDTTKPSTPGTITPTVVSSSQIDLTWVASTDNVGVTGYQIDRCTGTSCSNYVQIATSTTNAFSNTGLAANTNYRYRVRAVDAAGNVSSNSTVATAKTQVADTQAPTVPTNLTATAVSATQINLSWTASTDNVQVTNYLIERCQGVSCVSYSQIATIAATTFNDIGLTSGSYSYRVKAVDAANNASAYSSSTSAVTQYTGPITYTYTYDALGRITRASGSDGSSIDYQYDANGNVTSATRQ
jgi:YD repeat-containing protein